MAATTRKSDPTERAAFPVPEFAGSVGKTPEAIYQAIRRGHINAVRIGRTLYVPQREVERLKTGMR